jgi:hypothetical protein
MYWVIAYCTLIVGGLVFALIHNLFANTRERAGESAPALESGKAADSSWCIESRATGSKQDEPARPVRRAVVGLRPFVSLDLRRREPMFQSVDTALRS